MNFFRASCNHTIDNANDEDGDAVAVAGEEDAGVSMVDVQLEVSNGAAEDVISHTTCAWLIRGRIGICRGARLTPPHCHNWGGCI